MITGIYKVLQLCFLLELIHNDLIYFCGCVLTVATSHKITSQNALRPRIKVSSSN